MKFLLHENFINTIFNYYIIIMLIYISYYTYFVLA